MFGLHDEELIEIPFHVLEQFVLIFYPFGLQFNLNSRGKTGFNRFSGSASRQLVVGLLSNLLIQLHRLFSNLEGFGVNYKFIREVEIKLINYFS